MKKEHYVFRKLGTEQYFVDWIVHPWSKEILKELGVFGKRAYNGRDCRFPTGIYIDKAWHFHWKKGSMDKLVASGIYVRVTPHTSKEE